MASTSGRIATLGRMGLFLRPRRPLLRLAAGAATAGIAYQAGQRRAQQDVYDRQASAAYDASTVPPVGPGTDPTAELTRLSRLHDAGSLTDQEFTAAKATLLGAGTATRR